MIKKVRFQEVEECVEISNGVVSVIVSTGFGPRILSYAFDGGDNVLGWHGEVAIETDLGTWKPYGGHRLWLAPENMPLSYSPDNHAVACAEEGDLSVKLVQKADVAAGIEKHMSVTLAAEGTELTVDHRLTNISDDPMTVSAWALTIMRPGGTAVVPNQLLEPYGPDNLLPVRSMALWSYTDFTDPRWSFEKDSIRVRVDSKLKNPQKFGVLNKHAWAAYEVEGMRFTKRIQHIEGATYPDMNSNVEVYTAGDFVELETLSPLTRLMSGEAIDHREVWELSRF